ncbi:SDR family NAD(P)-dependent oxidoreductase [Streptomyces cocklensis]|uniref:Clavaldehyde dehydrogenase n=1 Tax=Actinacidiphila cocklensis TaxID=887465 RepID=A0A9W4DW46_9ACTN|nr:SDR family NAD(P)-dependent oxidoreductase [Actinacidiphila cocklensis]MDD1059827.1 SDR family NAD(P)-dependent oxidoreductase [Actinacidiphila cocklensis]WSX72696.1 SDR family NAD(P)-dependent oxidoreductase [Streptomyces sp. NBC_00899]WSX81236.1 SDR family NAD(P)-dependent oxidoreductase [Streptomyces sp. NBC_00899]CAG6397110.1 clavaldehyde dehydrogenase [Actinacidiphila cocklensis]
MAGRLQDTVALVTGASSGIGEATARALAAEGAAVAVLGRRRERLEKLADKVRAEGGTAIVVAADITDQRQAAAAVESVVSELGRLDTVVNNAGTMGVGPVVDSPLEEWERMVEINVRGLLYVTHAAVPHLLRAAEDSPRKVADLVNISSTAGRVARPGTAVYNLTKFGVNGFTEALRQEVMQKRVRVSLVEPGTVETELSSHLRDGVREAVERQVQGMELLQPQDIADAVSYIVTRDRRVAVNEILVRASEQTW